VTVEFSGTIWFWRGPAPWYFVTVPPEEARSLRAIANSVTYGWGMIPVEVRIGKTAWQTSLWPKDDSYIVPIKSMVRAELGLLEGDEVTVHLTV
jgi:hypothetical protein